MTAQTPRENFDKNATEMPSSVATNYVDYMHTSTLGDILDGNSPINIETLQSLVAMQASLHRARWKTDAKSLRSLLDKRRNTLRGFVLHTESMGPVGYSIYFPMMDKKGRRVLYVEDFYITEGAQRRGVFNVILHELAKAAKNEGAVRLQWATDERNYDVHAAVQHKGAIRPPVVTLDANPMLQPDFFDNLAANMDLQHIFGKAAKDISPARIIELSQEFTSRIIKSEDVDLPQQLGLERTFIQHNGDLPIKGFITGPYRPNKVINSPVAITAAWRHASTFQIAEGLYLEHPRFGTGTDLETKTAILLSVAQEAVNFALNQTNRFTHIKWHVQNERMDNGSNNLAETDVHKILAGFGLRPDQMVTGEPSELIPYIVRNGALDALANNEPNRCLQPFKPIGRGNGNGSGVETPAKVPVNHDRDDREDDSPRRRAGDPVGDAAKAGP